MTPEFTPLWLMVGKLSPCLKWAQQAPPPSEGGDGWVICRPLDPLDVWRTVQERSQGPGALGSFVLLMVWLRPTSEG